MSLLNEIIEEYIGIYKIMTCGKIYSIKSKKFLKQLDDGKGYKIVRLYKNGKGKTIKVHRLVALKYIDNPFYKKEINHKNGNKKDNYINNLEWVNRKENMKHAMDMGLINEKKLSKKQVKQIRFLKNKKTQKELAFIYKVNQSTISRIQNNKRRKYK